MPANAVRSVLLGTSSYTPSRGHASRVSMTPVSCAMPEDGTKTSWEANCVNPFSKVGVCAAQDGGVHLEKKYSMDGAILRAAQTPDGKARHRATFAASANRGGFLMAHYWYHIDSTLPHDVIKDKTGVGLRLFACFKTKLLDPFISSLKKPEGMKKKKTDVS